jgi:hypothetical protein
MRRPFITGLAFVASLLGALLFTSGRGDPEAAKGGGLWIGNAQVTASRATADIKIGYTMRSDFWFRVDAAGNVSGKAYAIYQPTFDPAGLNAKIAVAKSFVNGALTLFPGGQIAIARTAVEAGKGAVNLGVAGLIGVLGKYDDGELARAGKIVGSVRDQKLTLRWAERQPSGIPVTVKLQYINKTMRLTEKTLSIRAPWDKPATIDLESGGMLAVSQHLPKPTTKDGLTEATLAYWSASRVE